MASNSFGTAFRITTFGESHGEGVGCVIDGCPAGLALSTSDIQPDLRRRSPGRAHGTSARQEADEVEILSGVFEGLTTGAPIALWIENTDVDSSSYDRRVIRPGHADLTYWKKYGHVDHRGGGRASARETAARVAAGAVAKKLLSASGILITAWLSRIGEIVLPYIPKQDEESVFANAESPVFDSEKTAPIHNSGLVFSKSNLGLSALANSLFFNLFGYTYSQKEQEQVDTLLQKLSHEGDSVGGIVSCRIERVPPGLGDPMYEKLSAKLAFAMLSIPASRGFEIGEGFSAASMTGSEHNDPLFIHEGGVQSSTNHAGGVLGGISTGMPIFFRVAFKPTSSVRKEMATVTKEMTPEAFAKLETAICEVPAKGRAPISTKPIVVTMGEERSELTPRRREQSAVSSFAKASSATHGTSASARHDPCVAVRAVCVVEAMAALVIADAWLMNRSSSHQNFT